MPRSDWATRVVPRLCGCDCVMERHIEIAASEFGGRVRLSRRFTDCTCHHHDYFFYRKKFRVGSPTAPASLCPEAKCISIFFFGRWKPGNRVWRHVSRVLFFLIQPRVRSRRESVCLWPKAEVIACSPPLSLSSLFACNGSQDTLRKACSQSLKGGW